MYFKLQETHIKKEFFISIYRKAEFILLAQAARKLIGTSQVKKALEQGNLAITDVEVLRLHYALTLHHWQLRFQQHRHEIAEILNEEFCLM